MFLYFLSSHISAALAYGLILTQGDSAAYLMRTAILQQDQTLKNVCNDPFYKRGSTY